MDERAHKTRNALLDAAEELFGERGFAAVGNRELVARAGVNLAAIQYHFGSKRGLYLETVRRALHCAEAQRVWDLLREPPEERAHAAAVLATFVHALSEALLGEDELGSCAKLMLGEAMRPSEALEDFVHDFTRPHEELLVGLVRRIAPERTLPQARLAARSILGQLFHTHLFRPFLRRHGAPNELGPEDAPLVAAHVLEFSLRGLGLDDDLVRATLASRAHTPLPTPPAPD